MTLRKAYSEMMDRIVVTGQMRERILNRVQSENLEGQLSEKTCWQKYRKYFAAAACLAVFAAGTVTWNYTNSGDQPAQPSGGAAGGSSHAGGSTSGEEITGSGLSGDGQSESGPFGESQPGGSTSGNGQSESGLAGESQPGGSTSGKHLSGGDASWDELSGCDESNGQSDSEASGKHPSSSNSSGSSQPDSGQPVNESAGSETPGKYPSDDSMASSQSGSGTSGGAAGNGSTGSGGTGGSVQPGNGSSSTGTGGSSTGVVSGNLNREMAASVQELSERTGISIQDIKGLPFQSENVCYYAYGQNMAEIVYQGDGQQAVYRKSAGNGDNSGDYLQYDEVKRMELNGTEILLKGSAGRYVLAVWENETHSYSLSIPSGQEQQEWEAMIANIS